MPACCAANYYRRTPWHWYMTTGTLVRQAQLRFIGQKLALDRAGRRNHHGLN
jgi:hypothetical protein